MRGTQVSVQRIEIRLGGGRAGSHRQHAKSGFRNWEALGAPFCYGELALDAIKPLLGSRRGRAPRQKFTLWVLPARPQNDRAVSVIFHSKGRPAGRTGSSTAVRIGSVWRKL